MINWTSFADGMPPDAEGTWIVAWPENGSAPSLLERALAFTDPHSGFTHASGWFNDEGLGGGDDLASFYSHWALVTAPIA